MFGKDQNQNTYDRIPMQNQPPLQPMQRINQPPPPPQLAAGPQNMQNSYPGNIPGQQMSGMPNMLNSVQKPMSQLQVQGNPMAMQGNPVQMQGNPVRMPQQPHMMGMGMPPNQQQAVKQNPQLPPYYVNVPQSLSVPKLANNPAVPYANLPSNLQHPYYPNVRQNLPGMQVIPGIPGVPGMMPPQPPQPEHRKTKERVDVNIKQLSSQSYLSGVNDMDINFIKRIMEGVAQRRGYRGQISDDCLRAVVQGLKIYMKLFLERTSAYAQRRRNVVRVNEGQRQEIGSKIYKFSPLAKLAQLKQEQKILEENIPINTQGDLPAELVQAIAIRKPANEREEILSGLGANEREEEGEVAPNPLQIKGGITESDIMFVFQNLKSTPRQDVLVMQRKLSKK